jgi:LysM repeat protein
MTRETKIGLLVGLAFVIVIGILISDHLSNTNEPAGAPLRASMDNLRSSLGQQGDGDVAPPLRVPTSINPTQPVPTSEELTRRTPTHPPITFVDPPIHPGQTTPPVGNTVDRLREIARQHNEEIIDPSNAGQNDGSTNGNDSRLARNVDNGDRADIRNTPTPADPVKPTMRSYQAQPGDSLSAIALKAYGSNSKANRDAIIAANPALAENRDLIVVGRSYNIPSLSAAASAPIQPQPAKPTDATVTYTVKAHDTLWSIANSQVGSANAVATIRELNKDVLNGSDRVRPNMKLKLPARTAVSRND